jgi:hypothetical protein
MLRSPKLSDMRVVMNAAVRVKAISRYPNLLLVTHSPLRRDGTILEVAYADNEIHSWAWIVRRCPGASCRYEGLNTGEEIEVFRGPVEMEFPDEQILPDDCDYTIQAQPKRSLPQFVLRVQQRLLECWRKCFSSEAPFRSTFDGSSAGPNWRDLV